MDSTKGDKYQIELEIVWGEKPQALTDEIIQTWNRLGALPPGDDGKARAGQVVLVARSGSGQIIGITTAYLVKVDQLRNHLFAFRGLTDPAHRVPGLFVKMTIETLRFLESIHQEFTPKPIGVIAEIENKGLQKIRDVVMVTGFTLIGFSKRGHPMRVYYFKGAKY